MQVHLQKNMTEIGERIQKVARLLDKEVMQLCEKSDISHTTVYRWISGETRKPNSNSVRNFALANDINPDWLLDGKEPMFIRAGSAASYGASKGDGNGIPWTIRLRQGQSVLLTITLNVDVVDAEPHKAALDVQTRLEADLMMGRPSSAGTDPPALPLDLKAALAHFVDQRLEDRAAAKRAETAESESSDHPGDQ